MKLFTTSYLTQAAQLPQDGRHIVGQYDETSVVVYQAYRPEIAHFAVQNGYFGEEFSFSRMSWIKPNFLWMMYRSDWGTKPGQEVTLAIRIQRSTFDTILATAVHSGFVPEVYTSEVAWEQDVAQSSVRLQWDPDHHPSGAKLERRAIQLGLRDDVLAQYAREWIVDMEDISDFVQHQSQVVRSQAWTQLLVPSEAVYPVTDPETAKRLRLSTLEAI
ncbi:MAG: DUF4291 domain-containing protein (plasmid) [Leptolyngbya sp. BL-A-14]